ncbi:MAG TPA: tetratricopeptide repeat protein, partial [Casimicrobiaceae bacterium]
MSDPDDFESSALVREVRQLLKQGALREAESRVAERLARFPESADAWYMRGVIANRREDYAAAVAALRKAIAISPDAALAWLALGTAFARSDALPDAAEAYRAAIERAPAWADGHFNLGVVLKRQGDRLGAMRALHAAWVRDPMFFDAARQCVATLAECVRLGEVHDTA